MKRMYTGPGQAAFVRAIGSALGVQQVDDQCSGQANGVAFTPNSIDRTTACLCRHRLLHPHPVPTQPHRAHPHHGQEPRLDEFEQRHLAKRRCGGTTES